MNYNKIYESLIQRGQNRSLIGYSEKHHIIPKCVGGNDEQSNLVRLTPEEHYLAHLLLVKIYPDEFKLVYASIMMGMKRPSNKTYGWLKRRYAAIKSIEQKGNSNSQYGSFWITNEIENRKVYAIDFEMPEGWRRGRVMPEKRKSPSLCVVCKSITGGNARRKYCDLHLSKVYHQKGKKLSTEISTKLVYEGKYFITNGSSDKLLAMGENMPDGYRKGRVTNNKRY